MDVMTLAVAGVAALAILLIAVGVASSGRSGISDRLERYASGQKETKASQASQGPISDLIAQSQALANLNKVVEQRDFGANLARDIARADLKLKPSEFLFKRYGSPGFARLFDNGGGVHVEVEGYQTPIVWKVLRIR